MTEPIQAAPLPPNITIRRGTPADAEAIAQAHYEALDTFHEFYGAFFRKHPRELIPLMTARAFAKKEPPNVFYVAEERTSEAAAGGDVVGFVRYSIEEAKDGKEKKEEEKKEEKEGNGEEGEKEESPFACKEALKEVWKEFSDAQAKRDETLENAAQGRQHMWVHHLMIRPTRQRRGIGHALLSTALKDAEEAKVPVVIVSSAESVGLYKRVGFTSLGSFRLDNGHWAREVARVLPGRESEMLVERYDGLFEVEDVFVRGM